MENWLENYSFIFSKYCFQFSDNHHLPLSFPFWLFKIYVWQVTFHYSHCAIGRTSACGVGHDELKKVVLTFDCCLRGHWNEGYKSVHLELLSFFSEKEIKSLTRFHSIISHPFSLLCAPLTNIYPITTITNSTSGRQYLQQKKKKWFRWIGHNGRMAGVLWVSSWTCPLHATVSDQTQTVWIQLQF